MDGVLNDIHQPEPMLIAKYREASYIDIAPDRVLGNGVGRYNGLFGMLNTSYDRQKGQRQ